MLKGGQLARALNGDVLTFILSDVVGSPLDVIASGPTVADPTTIQQAQETLQRYAIQIASIDAHLQRSVETPKLGEEAFDRTQNVIVADNQIACEAALKRAQSLGFNTVLLTAFAEGDAANTASMIVSIAKQIRANGHPIAAPACIAIGGESTVKLSESHGIGGRNQHMALAAALQLELEDVLIVCLATDGTDGPTDSAGAMVDASTVKRGLALGLNARESLLRFDSYRYLDAVHDLLVTGPTRTNVNDVALLFVF